MRLAITGGDGQEHVVEFDSMPSEADIDEVSAQFKAPSSPSITTKSLPDGSLDSTSGFNLPPVPVAASKPLRQTQTKPVQASVASRLHDALDAQARYGVPIPKDLLQAAKAHANAAAGSNAAPPITEVNSRGKANRPLIFGSGVPQNLADVQRIIGNDDDSATARDLKPFATRVRDVKAANAPAVDPFVKIGLPFTAHDFNAANNAGLSAVRTIDGRSIDFAKALGMVQKAKGTNAVGMTKSQGDVEEEQTDALGIGAAVGKTVGFSKGQSDAQVPKGAAAKDLYGTTHFKDGHAITDSERVRDQVNQYTEGIKNALVNGAGMPELAAGLLAGIPTMALDLGAEQRTIGDTQETTENKLGAAANIAAFIAADSGGRALHELASPVVKRLIEGLKATDAGKVLFGAGDPEAAVRVAMDRFHLPEPKARTLVENVATHDPGVDWGGTYIDGTPVTRDRLSRPKPGSAAEQAAATADFRAQVESEKARIRGSSPDLIVNLTRRGNPIDLPSLSDDQLANLYQQVNGRMEAANASGNADWVAQSEHNLRQLDNERVRRATSIEPETDGLAPHGNFDRFGEAEQAAARRAAQEPVYTDDRWGGWHPDVAHAEAEEWFRKAKEDGRTVHVPDAGIDVGFTGAPEGKAGHNDSFGAAITPYVEELLAKSKVVVTEEAKRKGENFLSALRLVGRLETPDGPHDVWMLIRKDSNGHWYYDHSYSPEVVADGREPAGIAAAANGAAARPPQEPHSTPREGEASTGPNEPPPDDEPPAPPAKPEPPAPKGGDGEATGLSMAQRAEEAARLGTREPESVSGLTNPEAHAKGKASVESGEVDPYALVKRLADDNRAAKPEEYGAILEGRRRLLHDINAKAKAVDDAIGTDAHPQALADYEAAKVKAAEFDGHLDRVKGASGGSLHALKIGTTVDEGDFAAVVREAERTKGGKLDAKAEDQIRKLTEAHNAAQDRIAELERSQTQDRAGKSVRNAKPKAPRTLDQIRADRADAVDVFKTKTVAAEEDALAAAGELRLNTGPGKLFTREQAQAALTIAKTFAEEGVVHLGELVSKVREHIKNEAGVELSHEEVEHLLAGTYPKVERPKGEPTSRTAADQQIKAWQEELRGKTRAADQAKKDADRVDRTWRRREADADTRFARAEQRVKDKEARKPFQEAKRQARKDAQAARAEARKRYEDALGEAARLQQSIEDLTRKRDLIGPHEAPKVRTRNPELVKEYRERDAAKADVRRMIEAQRPKTVGQRVSDFSRMSALSGLGTFANLSSAVLGHGVISPFEELTGPIIRETVGRVGGLNAKAGAELDFNPKAEFQAVREYFSKANYADKLDILKGGEGEIGNKAVAEHLTSPHEATANVILRMEQRLHAVVKTGTKRNAFAREFVKSLSDAAAHGLDPQDPKVRLDAFMKGFEAADRGLFLNDSELSAISNKATARQSGAVKALVRVISPIQKVPVNVAARQMEYGFGLPYAIARHAWEASQGTMTPESAAAIARAYKRGSVGAALMVWAANSDTFDVDDSDNLVVGGYTLPTATGHVPALEALRMGVYYRKAGGFLDGLQKAEIGGGAGILRHTPFLEVPTTVVHAFGDFARTNDAREKAASKGIAKVAAGIIIPQGVQQWAKAQDADPEPEDGTSILARMLVHQGETTPRTTEGAIDEFKAVLPYTRKTLDKK